MLEQSENCSLAIRADFAKKADVDYIFIKYDNNDLD